MRVRIDRPPSLDDEEDFGDVLLVTVERHGEEHAERGLVGSYDVRAESHDGPHRLGVPRRAHLSATPCTGPYGSKTRASTSLLRSKTD